MSNSCDRHFGTLSAWLDGVAPSREVEELQAHLDHCAPCQEQYQQWLALRALLPSAMDPAVSSGFTARTAEGIQKVVSLERARQPGAVFSDLARMLCGGLAGGLVGATWAGLNASQRLSWDLGGESMSSFSPATYAEIQRYGMHSPSWLNNWPLGTILMLLIGLFMLRPWAFWRRLRSSEALSPWAVMSFGVGLLLVGFLGCLPALATLWADPERSVAGATVIAAAAWTLLCLALAGALLMFRCSRSVATSAWFLMGSIVVCMLLEPVVAPALVTPTLPGVSSQAFGLYRTAAEDAGKNREVTGHGLAWVPPQYPYNNDLTFFSNPVPVWAMMRLIQAPTILSPAQYWWTGVALAGVFSMLLGLLVGGPLHGDLQLTRPCLALSGLALLLVGTPWAVWVSGVLNTTHLTQPALAFTVCSQPHAHEERTVVSLNDTRGNNDGTLHLWRYPMPGLLLALLRRPEVASASQPGDTYTVRRYMLERSHAQLNWDAPTMLRAEEQLVAAQTIDQSLFWILRQLMRGESMTSPTAPTAHLATAAELTDVAPQYRTDAQRLVAGRLYWTRLRPLVPVPTYTVRGVIYVNGKPAADVPVRLWRGEMTNNPEMEPQRAIGECFDEYDDLGEVPIATRTDKDGRFRVTHPPEGEFFPVVMLPGQVKRARTTDRTTPTPFFEVGTDGTHRTDIDLGRFDVEVER